MDKIKKEGFEEELEEELEEAQDLTDEETSEVVEEAGEETEATVEEDEKVQEETSNEDNADPANLEDESLKSALARLQADFQNYRNRTEKERASIHAYANEKLVKKLLPVIDNLERAIATEKEHDAFFEGVQMIYNELIKVLEKEDIVRFDPVGEKFDPNFHQAVFMEESETVESEHIIETFQVGYKIKDKVIRPAMVKVSK